MSIEELEEFINKKKNNLSNNFTYSKDYPVYKKFLDENKLDNIEDFANIDIKEFCSMYYSIKSNISYDESKDLMEKVTTLASFDSISKFRMIINSCFSLEKDILNKIIELFKSDNITKYKKQYAHLFQNTKVDFDSLVKFKIEYSYEINYLVKIFEKIAENDVNFFDTLYLFITQQELVEDIENINKYATGEEEKLRLINEAKERYSFREIRKPYNIIKTKVSAEDKAKERYSNSIKEKLRLYDKALARLKEERDVDEIVDYSEIIVGIEDEEVVKAILRFVNEHNMKYYRRLEEKITTLKKYKIDMPIEQLKLLNSDYKEILKLLSPYNFPNLEAILQLTDLNSVNKIIKYIKKDYIHVSYLINDISMFDKDGPNLEIFEKTIDTLNNMSINPSIFNDYISLIIKNNNIFLNNLEVIKEYNLIKNLSFIDNYEFMFDNKLAYKIDRLIELNLYSYLKDDLNILNSSKLKRLDLLKVMGYEITDKEMLDKVLNGEFFVADEEIDSYLPDVLSLNPKLDLSGNLSEFMVSNLIYKFNGVIISKNKVDRYLKDGYDLYTSLFRDTILTDDEYFRVIDCFKSFQKK